LIQKNEKIPFYWTRKTKKVKQDQAKYIFGDYLPQKASRGLIGYPD
jgi:hypothetical protein